ncbi:MAG: hypothetical protein JWR69_1059 [Pedosphaera sp.]|nr:hypothetical protein [Pedosphaera sp.]
MSRSNIKLSTLQGQTRPDPNPHPRIPHSTTSFPSLLGVYTRYTATTPINIGQKRCFTRYIPCNKLATNPQHPPPSPFPLSNLKFQIRPPGFTGIHPRTRIRPDPPPLS